MFANGALVSFVTATLNNGVGFGQKRFRMVVCPVE